MIRQPPALQRLPITLVNNTNDVQTVVYTFTPHIRPGDTGAECANGVPVVITIKINPQPKINVTSDLELCYDGPARFDITNPNTVNTGATWYYDLSPVVYPAGVAAGTLSGGLTDQTDRRSSTDRQCSKQH